MKVLLVDPHVPGFRGTNIAILDLAGYLREYGFTVDVCSFRRLPDIYDYNIVGLSCVCSFNGLALNQLKFLVNKYRRSEIVLGGKWTVTMPPDIEREIKSLGVSVIRGNGESFFVNGTIDYLNYPLWHEIDLSNVYTNGYMMSSRGCPFRCNFCNNTEKGLHFFSSERTVKIIKLLLDYHPTVQFVDDIFTVNLENMMVILDECKRYNIDIKGKSSFFVHANMPLRGRILSIIKEYSPFRVYIGLESGSDRMLKLMGKTVKVADIKDIIPKLKAICPVEGLWIIGYPGETIESLEATVTLVKELKLDFNWFGFYQPVYNTVGYSMSIKEGKIVKLGCNTETISFIPNGLSATILEKYRKLLRSI